MIHFPHRKKYISNLYELVASVGSKYFDEYELLSKKYVYELSISKFYNSLWKNDILVLHSDARWLYICSV